MQIANFGLLEWVLLGGNLLLGLLGGFFLIWLYWYSARDKNKLSQIEKHCEQLHKLLSGSRAFRNLESAELMEAKWNHENLDLVASTLDGLSRDDLRKLSDSLDQYGELISEMDAVEPADFANWKHSRQTRINGALDYRSKLQNGSDNILEKIQNAHAMVNSVKSRTSASDSTQAWLRENGVIRDKLDESVSQDKLQRAQIETELTAARETEARLRQDLLAERERLESLREHSKQHEQSLSNKFTALQTKYDELKSAHDRMLLEKDFIEKAYMKNGDD
ncbi:MAG: hypothetical protein ABSB19_00070 [Methylomonas sp.]|jgi:hypothetical protein